MTPRPRTPMPIVSLSPIHVQQSPMNRVTITLATAVLLALLPVSVSVWMGWL